jgi:hypothetical protein
MGHNVLDTSSIPSWNFHPRRCGISIDRASVVLTNSRHPRKYARTDAAPESVRTPRTSTQMVEYEYKSWRILIGNHEKVLLIRSDWS